MRTDLRFCTFAAAWTDFQELGKWEDEWVAVPCKLDASTTQNGVMATSWWEALDATSGVDLGIALRRTTRPAVARMSPVTVATSGTGELCRIEAPVSLQSSPAQFTEMVDDAMRMPMNPGGPGCLNVAPGSIVAVAPTSSDEGSQKRTCSFGIHGGPSPSRSSPCSRSYWCGLSSTFSTSDVSSVRCSTISDQS